MTGGVAGPRIPELNACRHGDRVLRAADGYSAFDVEPGFDDHYAVAPMPGEVPAIAGMIICDGKYCSLWPMASQSMEFGRKFPAVMAPYELEPANRKPRVIFERFLDGLSLMAMPRYTEVSAGTYRHGLSLDATSSPARWYGEVGDRPAVKRGLAVPVLAAEAA